MTEVNESENAIAADVAADVAVGDEIAKLKVSVLKDKLRELELPTTGKKAVLVERLKAALISGEDDELTDDDDDSNDEEEGSAAESMVQEHTNKKVTMEDLKNLCALMSQSQMQKKSLQFQDVADSIPFFSGDKGEHVSRWVNNFEATAEMANWNDIEKIINAKRKFVDSAKLFAQYECQAVTWQKFKAELLEEFSVTANSKQVHKQLATTKKRENESLQEFVYRMLQIASQIELEEEAQIQYIIEGIPDEERNKTILYGASTIKELRKKLKQYEVFKNNVKKNVYQKPTGGDSIKKRINNNNNNQPKRCFNCGSLDHLSTSCPNKESGPKCFKCDEYGHIAPKCTKSGRSSEEAKGKKVRVDMLNYGDKKTYKIVNILGKEVKAVVDPGSDLHLIGTSLYLKLGAPKLQPSTVLFSGVGSIGKSTLGKFRTEIIIDEIMFNFVFEVIPDYYIGHDLIIGGELSDYAEVRIRNRQATLSEIDSEYKTAVQEVLNINILDEPEEDCRIDLTHVLDQEVKAKLTDIIEGYSPKNCKDSGVQLRIMLKDDMPVHQHPRRLSQEQKEIVNKIIADWYKSGIVRPSISEYASPIVLVEKRNNDYRLCVDYRELNKKVLRDRNPLPLIEDQIDKLQGAKIFSTLDLKDGFFHVAVEENSIKYTSFVVPDGQWEFCRMPFGFANSPAVFQRHVRVVFKDFINQGVVMAYLDDLIIPAMNEVEGLEKLTKVLETAAEYGLIINWKKCNLLVTSVEYLGYIIEAGRYSPSNRKTTAVAKFPKPSTTKQIQSFLGLTGYFRKFIPQFARRARPLSDLLKDGVKFQFGTEQESAFEDLKMALLCKPVLKLYRHDAETELHTDACMGGLGAILLQKNTEDNLFHPIYYASWKTSDAEEKYTSFELEFLAVIKAVKKFRVYLLGISFKIVTDCQAFALTLRKKDSCLRVSHWVILLEQFKYTVEHRPGTAMKHVDALSRNPVDVFCVNVRKETLMARLQRAQREDVSLKEYFKKTEEETSEFELKGNGVLYRVKDGVEQLVIPKSMQHEIIRTAHEKGHFGWRKIEYLLLQEFWFPMMREKIKKLILNCVRCILAEKKSGKAEGWLNPIGKGETPLDTYHVDFLGPVPSTRKSYNHLYVVIDGFTKFAWIYPTKSVSAEEAINCLKRQATIFGNPRCIISDRGSAFTSNMFAEYCKKENIQHHCITTGVPRGNGQVERLNRIIIAVLTKLSIENPLEWYKHVNILQQMINSTMQRSIGKTPFELLVGTKMKLNNDIELRELIDKEIVEYFEERRSDLRDEARTSLLKIQEENRKTYNRKRKEAKEYEVGNLVAIQRTQFGTGQKLAPKFLGPYKVTRVMRNQRYLVEKVGTHEGPNCTSSSADLMKPWPADDKCIDDLMDDREDA